MHLLEWLELNVNPSSVDAKKAASEQETKKDLDSVTSASSTMNISNGGTSNLRNSSNVSKTAFKSQLPILNKVEWQQQLHSLLSQCQRKEEMAAHKIDSIVVKIAARYRMIIEQKNPYQLESFMLPTIDGALTRETNAHTYMLTLVQVLFIWSNLPLAQQYERITTSINNYTQNQLKKCDHLISQAQQYQRMHNFDNISVQTIIQQQNMFKCLLSNMLNCHATFSRCLNTCIEGILSTRITVHVVLPGVPINSLKKPSYMRGSITKLLITLVEYPYFSVHVKHKLCENCSPSKIVDALTVLPNEQLLGIVGRHFPLKLGNIKVGDRLIRKSMCT
jgi:hypothetical protein